MSDSSFVLKDHIRSCSLSSQARDGPHISNEAEENIRMLKESETGMNLLSVLRKEMEEMDTKYQEKFTMQQKEINKLKKLVSVIKEEAEKDRDIYEKRYEEQRNELSKLSQESVKFKSEVEVIASEILEIKEEVSSIRSSGDDRYDTLHLELSDVRKDLSGSEKKNNMLKRQVKQFERCILELRLRIGRFDCGEYVWMIPHFSEVRKDAESGKRKILKSEPFYSFRNGYKMCIRIYPNGFGSGFGTYLYLGFVIMKGEYDDVLQWPFRHRVTLSIINQTTGEDHTKMEYEYSTTKEELRYILERSMDEKNVGLGYSKFILLDYLTCNPDIFNGDKVYFRCYVRPSNYTADGLTNHNN